MPEPSELLECCRCRVRFNPKRVRYLWVGYGERGAVEHGKRGCMLLGTASDPHRRREQGEDVFCGPCGDQWRDREERFRLGEGLDSFDRREAVARGVVFD